MTTCGKCGAGNVAGDAFCGACGAYLEFAAEEATEVATDESTLEGATGEPPPDPGPTPVASPLPVPSQPPLPTSGAGPVSAASGDAQPAPAPGPICGACGRQNPAGRTFCVSCGERLEAGASAATAGGSVAGGAPAPKGPARPTWDFPTAPIPAATPKPAPSSDEAAGGSRLPLLAGLVLVLVLVGGAAAFVVTGGLAGGGSTPGTARPGGSGAAVATPDATPTAAAATGETATPEPTPAVETPPPATPTATIPSGPAVGIAIAGARASSQLAARRAPKFLYDGSPATAWKSATGEYEGSWIEVSFPPAAVTRLQIWGGWQADEPLYRGNHRPRNVTVSFDGGIPVPLTLQDLLGAQRVDIPPELGIARATTVRITILDTYPAKKTAAGGSPTEEVAVSEIRIFGVPVTP